MGMLTILFNFSNHRYPTFLTVHCSGQKPKRFLFTPTPNFIKNICTPAHSCNYPVAAERCIKSCRYSSRAAVNVHIKQQNVENLNDFDCTMVTGYQMGWFESFRNLLGFFFHTKQSLEFIQNGAENKKTIQWVDVLWVETYCWLERSEETGQTGLGWQEGYANLNSHPYNRCGKKEKPSRPHKTSMCFNSERPHLVYFLLAKKNLSHTGLRLTLICMLGSERNKIFFYKLQV